MSTPGTLRASRPGKRWLIPESALDDLIDDTSNIVPVRRRRRRAS